LPAQKGRQRRFAAFHHIQRKFSFFIQSPFQVRRSFIMNNPIKQMGITLAAALVMTAGMNCAGSSQQQPPVRTAYNSPPAPAPVTTVAQAAPAAIVDNELNITTTAQTQPQRANPYFTGDGGKGISIAILAPTANGLTQDQNYLPALVQGEFVSNFSGYSAISVLDRERLDTINIELISPVYDDSAIAKQARLIGNLAHTTHIMGGNITKTATGYALQMHITKTDDRTAAASYSGTFTFLELDNLTGVRRASLELLQKMSVALSEKAQEELAGAATESRVNAQTALAKGVTAQMEKNEVAALSYYFQAVAFDPSLKEATNRSSKLNANITSGSMGDNIRNDIQWRKDWVARLTETEHLFDNFNKTESMPYTLYYSDDIKQGEVNYQTETVNLSIETILIANDRWARPMERTLQAVYDGLDATKRKETWKLNYWPYQGVTELEAFATREREFSVVFELLNNQNKIIGRQTLQTDGYWRFKHSRPDVWFSEPTEKTVNFQNVNANDITDRMTIRIASVNGANAGIAAKNGTLQIRTFIKGVTAGAALKDSRDGKSYRTVIIGSQTWMAENLNYQTGNSKCYGNDASNCAKYGRLYDWSTALEACPVGWHLPSDYEWTILENVVIGGSSTAGTKLKSKTGWNDNGNGTDDVGFSALPSGRMSYPEDRSFLDGEVGDWWTASVDEFGRIWHRYIHANAADERVRSDGFGYTDLRSVRCVQD
jgi:uncharacterized protein (TIGR02145 family)